MRLRFLIKDNFHANYFLYGHIQALLLQLATIKLLDNPRLSDVVSVKSKSASS